MPPSSEQTSTPLEALHTLVVELFGADEFRRWLRRGPAADIVPELPGESAADAVVVDAALVALRRRGQIDAAFFARLTTARPRRSDAIAAVAVRWGEPELAPAEPSRSPSSPPPSTGTPKANSREPGLSSRTGAAAAAAPRETVLASWIHVSDLHFGHGDAGHQWNQQSVLAALLADAQALVREVVVPPPGFIFVTGDIAFSGGARTPVAGKAEYMLAAQWLGQLQKVLEIPTERVFMVPGNHDVDRKVDADVRRLLQLARAGHETIDEILQAPRELDRLRGRMARYLAFAAGFGLPARERCHGGLWWRQRVELEEGVSLRICGLNTALLSVDDQDQGKLRISQRQLSELFLPTPGELELAVVLGHHPPTGKWLADEKELQGQLDRHGAIHLFGHLHEADSEQASRGWGPGGVRIAAGAAHAEAGAAGSPPVGHGYNFGALVALGSGDLVVRIWPRRWSTRTPRFVADVDNTPDRREHAEHPLPAKYRIHRPPPTPGLHPGEVLGDRYRLVADVGQGGVGQVWRASDLRSGDTVAVKVLNPDGAEPDPGRRAVFFRGAQAVANLKHPAIARVRDPRPDPEKKYGAYDFYVMDFIAAPNLSAAFKRAPRSDAETLEILLAIGEGIAAAHQKRVIHRDLKPSNILRDPATGQVFIIDFDTAKDLGNLTMTRSGEGFASAYYTAPEVLMSLNPPPGGAPPPDERADIFSLAVIGVFLRTGRDPTHFFMPEVIERIECAQGLKDVLAKGCTHSAAKRYASVGEMLAALRRLQASYDVQTTEAPPPRQGPGVGSTPPPPPLPRSPGVGNVLPEPVEPSSRATTRAHEASAGSSTRLAPVHPVIEVERPPPTAVGQLPPAMPASAVAGSQAPAPFEQPEPVAAPEVIRQQNASNRKRAQVFLTGFVAVVAIALVVTILRYPSDSSDSLPEPHQAVNFTPPPKSGPETGFAEPEPQQSVNSIPPPKSGPETGLAEPSELATARAVLRTLGDNQARSAITALQELTAKRSKDSEYVQMVNRATLLQAELILQQVLSAHIALSLVPNYSEAQLIVQRDDVSAASILLTSSEPTSDPAHFRHLQILLALASGAEPDLSSSDSQEDKALVLAAPLWGSGPSQAADLQGLIETIEHLPSPPALHRSVLAMAYLRSGAGNGQEAKAFDILKDILDDTPDMLAAHAVRAELDRRSGKTPAAKRSHVALKKVDVLFDSVMDAKVQVGKRLSSRRQAASCKAPCRIPLAPGSYQVLAVLESASTHCFLRVEQGKPLHVRLGLSHGITNWEEYGDDALMSIPSKRESYMCITSPQRSP